MTVAQLLDTMSSAEFGEWLAFHELEPFGPLQDDFRAGVCASTSFNMLRGDKTKPRGPAAFMPALQRYLDDADELPDDATPAEIARYLDTHLGLTA